jgi:hypothetical protein
MGEQTIFLRFVANRFYFIDKMVAEGIDAGF